MKSPVTVLMDANVFYGIRVTSLILHLAQTKLFRARWTERIHEEWIGNLHRKTGIPREKLERRRQAIDHSVLDCLVNDYEALENIVSLPDGKDHHVLAAALKVRADCIVTFNLSDFPVAALAPLGIAAIHPDEFIIDVFDMSEELFIGAVGQDIRHYKTPPLTFNRYSEDLRKAGLPKTARLIEELKALIDTE
jgi:predicted nucleic acid-binding protein